MSNFTVVEPWKFETITPSQYLTFTMPNVLNHRRWLSALVLRFAVLDSPTANANDQSPVIAAMVVPKNRESDWMFCSQPGHLQFILKSPNVSRLILIGNNPPKKPGLAVYKRPPVTNTIEQEMLENELQYLLMSLHPQVSFRHGLPGTLFLKYEDDIAYRVTVATFKGSIVGEFLVEDVQLVANTDGLNTNDDDVYLRRRLRFKRIPNLSQALLLPLIGDDHVAHSTDLETLRTLEGIKFEADTEVLFHKYQMSMISGVSLIVPYLKVRLDKGISVNALCLGIGTGIFLNFLENQMRFIVTGVEADKAVIAAATEHFGFIKSNTMRLIEQDAIEAIQTFPPRKRGRGPDGKFDVVFVDLYSSEGKSGFSAPPREFVHDHVFGCFRRILDDRGALIIHVIPSNELFFTTLVEALKRFFRKVYRADSGKEDTYVVIAILSPASTRGYDDDNIYINSLKTDILGTSTYIDSIAEL